MAAGKIFAISFAINAIMGGSFASVMSQSSTAMQQLKNKTTFLNAEQRRLSNAWNQSQMAARTYQTTIAGLRAQLSAGQISQSQYAASVQRAEQAMRAAGMSVEEYRSHMTRLRQEASQTQARLEQFKKAAAAKQEASARFSSARTGVMETAATVGMLAAPIVGAVETAAKFEASMSKVAAITRTAGTPAIQELTENARMLGETTQFSATQAADAMSYLGMAGWNAEQIMAGMPGLLALAAAGGTDLARTADIVSDDLTAFGLSAEQAGHMADVFAVTATRTNTNVEMIGETMKYAAPVARAFGASMEETAAMTGLMANAGVKASQAGTSLRAGFLRLTGPPKKGAKAMEELGMSMSELSAQQAEASAALKDLGIDMDSISGTPSHKMVAILTELKEKTAGLTSEQKLGSLQAIFGTEAATGWLNVLEAGPGVFEELVAQMENCDGEAEKMASVMMDNAKGAVTQLKSALESVAISVGSIFLPGVTAAARGAASMAGGVSKWVTEHKELTASIVSTGAALSSLIVSIKLFRMASAAWSYARASLKLYQLTMMTLGETAIQSAAGQRVLTAATAAQGRAMSLLSAATSIDTYKRLKQAAIRTAAQLRAITWTQIGQNVGRGISSGSSTALKALTMLRTNAMMTMAATRKAVASTLANIAVQAASAGRAVLTMTRSFTIAGALQSAAAGFRALGAAILSIGRVSLAAMFSPLGIAVMAIAGAAYLIYSNWAQVGPFFMGLWEQIQQAFSNAWAMIQPAVEQLGTAFGAMMDAMGPVFASLSDTISAAFEQISATVSANSEIFNVLVQAGILLAEIFGGTLIAAFILFADIAVGAVTAAIGVVASVITGAIGIFTGLIEFITGVFTGDWSAAWQGVVQIFSSIFGTISGIANSILGGIQLTINGIVGSIRSVAASLPGLSGGGGGEIAANAQGGIYRKGAFLTTFAEEGPEAAIPLDGSPRAIGLWKMAGEMLGVGEAASGTAHYEQTPTENRTTARMPEAPKRVTQRAEFIKTAEPSAQNITIEQEGQQTPAVTVTANRQPKDSWPQQTPALTAPPISITVNVYGNETEPDKIRQAVVRAGQTVQRTFAEQMEQYKQERGRLAFD